MAVNIEDTLFQLPTVVSDPMYAKVMPIDNSALTSGDIGGSGTFDVLMASLKSHLRGEFEAGRITGAEYTKTYIEMTQMALQMSVQFVLGRAQAFWQAQQAQIEAITGRIAMETARYNFETILPLQAAAETKKNLSLDLSNQAAQYNIDTMLPLQTDEQIKKNAGLDLSNSAAQYNLNTLLPLQSALLTLQNTGEDIKNQSNQFTLTNILPLQSSLLGLQNVGEDLKNQGQSKQNAQLDFALSFMLPAQLTLVTEQGEVQHAQTSDERMDGGPVSGLIGQQKNLYAQQIVSYQRDAEVKAGKLFSDAWITQKTIDEGLDAPTGFTNASLDQVLNVIKSNNGFA